MIVYMLVLFLTTATTGSVATVATFPNYADCEEARLGLQQVSAPLPEGTLESLFCVPRMVSPKPVE